MADLLPEKKEPDGLLKAAEGDVEGVEVFGLAEEAVQPDFQEVQFVQEGGGVGLVGMASWASWRRRCLVWRLRAEGLRF